jgi:hypothetical protein
MYLICDFDGTLVKNDYFVEQLSAAMIRNPFKIISQLVSKSTLEVKHIYLDNFNPQSAALLLNEEVSELVKTEKSKFTKTILLTASTNDFIKKIHPIVPFFDEVYGSTSINLKSSQKLNFIREMKLEPFVYIGDSKDDEILFEHANYYYKVIKNKPVLFKP